MEKRKITRSELNEIITNHQHWLREDIDGWELKRADLSNLDLSYANLTGAHLSDANLTGANLANANFTGAHLSYANLTGANLTNANLTGAYLSNANLTGANLTCSNLKDSDLTGINVYNVHNMPNIPLACPSEGSFIGWKKIGNNLIKLEIPKDARRSSSTSIKCRCDKAKVIGIYNLDGSESNLREITNYNFQTTLYKIGKMVYPDSYDENRWNECSNGIHFFIDKQSAIDY